MTHARISTLLVLFTAALLVRCADSPDDHELPSISVSPRDVNLGFGQQQRFTATVKGLESTSVRWSVLEGASGGSIDAEGLYTAPAVEGTFHVVAISEADPSRSNSATVNVRPLDMPIAVSITPLGPRVTVGTTRQFTATVTGTSNTAVTWSVTEAEGGTIDASGLYTAPATPGTYHVVATSVADPTKKATATVTAEAIQMVVAVSIQPSSTGVVAGQTRTFTATVTGTSNTAVTWSVTEAEGGTIDASGLYTAPATPGTYHVVATSVADPTKKATATVIVTEPEVIGVAIAPTETTARVNETRQFTATVTGTTNTAVTWSVTEAEGGTIDASGLYTAPATPGTYHVVATSVADTTRSATATVTVLGLISVTVSPALTVVGTGESRTFTATVNTSNNAVTWSIQEGAAGGSIDASGLYTAPATPGTYHVVATSEADPTKSATATITVKPFPAAGLALYFAADRLLGPESEPPADGVPVSRWVDLSGNARDLSQTEAARQPLFKATGLNGRPTVAFDGSSTAGQGDYLRSDPFASTLSQPLTVFFVYKAPPVDTNKTLIDAPLTAGAKRVRLQATTIPVGGIQLYTNKFTSPGTAKAVNTFHFITAVFNGTSTRLRGNGTEENLPNRDPGPEGMGGLMLGGRQDLLTSAFAATEFAELLVFERVLSDTEVGQVEAYLKSRYFPSP